MLMQHEIDRRFEERMPRTDELRKGTSGYGDELLLEGDSLVRWEDARSVGSFAGLVSDSNWNFAEFVPARFALARLAAKTPIRLEKEAANVVRLEPPRLSPFELVAHARHSAYVEEV